jgi:hypothetical protein
VHGQTFVDKNKKQKGIKKTKEKKL